MDQRADEGDGARRRRPAGGRDASRSIRTDAAAGDTRSDPVTPRPPDWLQRTIETEIVPRLMLAHRAGAIPAPPVDPTECGLIACEDIEAFSELLVRDEVEACEAFVAALRERGVALEDVYLGLLAPAARRLGLLWCSDHCDFGAVTLGLWRLQSLVFDLSPQLPLSHPDRPGGPRRVLLAVAPGSQHTFGLLMVGEFFRRAGWDVWSDPSASQADLVSVVRSDWFDLIGISVGHDGHLALSRSVILALRRALRNPTVGVLVGGPVTADHPELAAEVGADLAVSDARQAVDLANTLLGRRAVPA